MNRLNASGGINLIADAKKAVLNMPAISSRFKSDYQTGEAVTQTEVDRIAEEEKEDETPIN